MPSGLRYAYPLVLVVGGIGLMFTGSPQAAWLGAVVIAVAVVLGVLALKGRS